MLPISPQVQQGSVPVKKSNAILSQCLPPAAHLSPFGPEQAASPLQQSIHGSYPQYGHAFQGQWPCYLPPYIPQLYCWPPARQTTNWNAPGPFKPKSFLASSIGIPLMRASSLPRSNSSSSTPLPEINDQTSARPSNSRQTNGPASPSIEHGAKQGTHTTDPSPGDQSEAALSDHSTYANPNEKSLDVYDLSDYAGYRPNPYSSERLSSSTLRRRPDEHQDNIVSPVHEAQDSGQVQPNASQKASPGRLDCKSSEALSRGLGDLDKLLKTISDDTGLTSTQIIQRWRPSDTRPANLWNSYQKYFQVNTAQELGRLPQSRRPEIGEKFSTTTIKQAYSAFRKDEPNYESILKLFRRIEEIGGSNTTLNSRSHRFRKYVEKLKRLADSASTVDGFETVFGSVGAVVHQDQSLSAIFCSQMVPNFFSDRLRIPDDEVEGHLKAHAYDYSSKKSLGSSKELTPAACGRPHTSTASAPAKKKSKNEKLLEELKKNLFDLTSKSIMSRHRSTVLKAGEQCRIPELQQARFPFTQLPKLLAQGGWVLENWPEDVPFPCDVPMGKGIARLPIPYREPLLRAFEDPRYPLRIIKKYSSAVPASEPVIIGIPPRPESVHSHGRRRFLGGSQIEDRKGPERETDLASKRALGESADRSRQKKRPAATVANLTDQEHERGAKRTKPENIKLGRRHRHSR